MQNLFIGEGNLGHAPTLKYVPIKDGTEQKAVLEFDAKFNVQKLNRKSGEFEDNGGFWATVELWGKRAEYFNDFLVKGCRVLVVGELSHDTYVATKGERVGQTLSAHKIVAEHVALVLLGIDSITYSERKQSQQFDAAEETDSIPFDTTTQE